MHDGQTIKNIPFELKEISDTGEFVGMASVYGNIDLGNDVVEPGAFDKSIKEHGAKVRLMDNHRVRIGVATVQSTPEGLKAVGKINTDKQSGAEALSDLKFYQQQGLPLGMSFGYLAKDYDPAYKTKDGARHLKELRLLEITITEMPMNQRALVENVKSIQALIASVKAMEEKTDFDTELAKIQLRAMIYMLESALCTTLWKIRWVPDIADRVAASAEAIDKYKAGYLAVLPEILEMDTDSRVGYMSLSGLEEKAGRVLSQASREAITDTITKLQGLLDSAAPSAEVSADTSVESDPDKKSLSPNGETPEAERDDNPPAAVDLIPQIEGIRSLIPK